MPRTAKAVRPKPGQIVSTQCVRSGMCPGGDGERARPAQKGATCTLHGLTRKGLPRGDGERARPAQKGATCTLHGLTREGLPGGDGERARPAQKEQQ